MDNDSIDTVDQIEKNIEFVLNGGPFISKKDAWIFDNTKNIDRYIKKYTRSMYFPINHKEETVFYYKHWINYVENLKKLIQWKDIIDCWAYIGDSAMMFTKELWFSEGGGIKQIFCLEPDFSNRKLLVKTINGNKMNGKIIPVPLWVWKKKETLYIDFNWSASTVWDKGNKSNSIQIDTIDNIVDNYNINPWLIKWDIEWLEYDSILWAEDTIKKFKPVLLISIYHNGKDFYEIKPLIESWNVEYKFKIRHLSTHLFYETMLICY